jgi:HK97 family phage portal protein
MASWLEKLFGPSQYPQILNAEGRYALGETLDIFQIPMVVATRQLISDTVASFTMYAEDAAGNRTQRIPLILESPSALEPLADLLERQVNDMTRYGSAVLRITARDGADNPLAVELISPERVEPVLDSYDQNIRSWIIDDKPVPLRDVVYSPMVLDNSPIGKAPLLEIEFTLRQLQHAYSFAAEFYQSPTPTYALVSGTRLPPAQAKALMASWQDAREASRPALLTGDLSLETFDQQTAADALLIDAINTAGAEVARVMQVPPSLVNSLAMSSLTYSTALQEARRWLSLGLNSGYLSRLEVVYTQLLPRGYFAKFDTSTLTALDESTQLDDAIKGLQAGILTVNEAREKIGRDPIGSDALQIR